MESNSIKIGAWLLLMLVILIFVGSSVLMKFIVSDTSNAFSVTYYCVSLYAFMIPFVWLKRKFYPEEEPLLSENSEDLEGEYSKKFFTFSLMAAIFWYFGNSLYNFSLGLTSVTSANSLSNSSLVFISVLEYFFVSSQVSKLKILALLVSIAGLTLMYLFDASNTKDDTPDTVTGNLLSIAGAFFYSCYTVSIKNFSNKNKKQFNMADLFGNTGLIIFCLCPILLVLLHFTGIETFHWLAPKDYSLIALNALVGGLGSCYLLGYCVTLLNPHTVQFGLTLTIPLSYLYDFFYGNVEIEAIYIAGSILIFSSFGMIFYENYKKAEKGNYFKIIPN